ncbi:Stromal cell-derived factor 2-like protein 1 [Frankliniella fusca]|uniref:Stromal cell-derived factor 2-like protein 1 n=1 Tax=Frankliniella fusca TaxID=407009 RepID=A0AAE1HQ02_9NEOP|nr:Stromal cell-derived factor 2-like protein 1 [Frankliniella fusca]
MSLFDRIMKTKIYFLLVLLCVTLMFSYASGKSARYVSCGSVIKLMNSATKIRLHSHDVKYGTGSGQQSVTGVEEKDDSNSHWVVKAENGKQCTRGEPISCGSIIRLEHLTTNKNLHSHLFPSPISNKQEISAYGSNGEGDTGDNWKLICSGSFWDRKQEVSFQHVDTNAYLGVSGRQFGRPISGQAEVVGEFSISSTAQWMAMEGLFIHKNEFDSRTVGHDPSEL